MSCAWKERWGLNQSEHAYVKGIHDNPVSCNHQALLDFSYINFDDLQTLFYILNFWRLGPSNYWLP